MSEDTSVLPEEEISKAVDEVCEETDTTGHEDNCALSVPTEVSYDWQDITEEFLTACDDLKLGQLLNASGFGLFEAMSAIEMMDPKMDAGMVCNQAQRQVYNLPKAIEAGVIKIKELESNELIGIVDDTLACIVTWLEGHSLAQTVFTNLYLHDPTVIEDKTLKALSLSVLRIVDHLKDTVNKACVIEEEDFQSLTYGFKLAGEVSDSRVMGMLKEVEEDINKVIRNTKTKAGEEKDEDKEQKHEIAVALHARIKFHRIFLATLIAFEKEKTQGITEAEKLLDQLTDLINTMKTTQDMGITATDDVASPCDYPTIMGFEPLVNQRLLPPTFPRYTKIKPRDEAIKYFIDLIQKLKIVCKVVGINDLHMLLDFFQDFSNNSPCVFARSILQLVFMTPTRRIFGVSSMQDWIREAIRGFILPPFLMPKGPLANNTQCKEYCDAFFNHATRPMINLFLICGHNRARQRDKYGHLLEDLVSLQEEANKVDAYVHRQLIQTQPNFQYSANLATWVLYHTLSVMIRFTLAGFELELYSVHEYHYIFWYLYECLYRWQASTLSRTDTFYQNHQEYMHEQQTKGRSNKKRDKKSKKQQRTRPHAVETLITQAAQNLCGGYYKALIGLRLAGKIPQPSQEFDSEEVRYNHRFAPFGALMTPPPVQYCQFQEMTNLQRYSPQVTPQDLYLSSCDCFHQARLFYESVVNPSDEVLTLLKIAKRNFVLIKLLHDGHKKDSKEPPTWDFTQHKIFPVIKLA